MGQFTRRGFVVAAAAVLTGCAASNSNPKASGTPASPGPSTPGPTTPVPTTPAPTTPAPTTPAPTSPTLPAVTAWRPNPNDLAPDCKLTAVRRIESLGNGPHSALQVVDAQYGGLLTDSASVLVVSRSWRLLRDRLVPGGHTYDVRLSRVPNGWRITAIHPSTPGPRAHLLSPTAHRVLTSERIVLPPAAAADVASGQVHDSALRAMLTLAASYRVGVSVVRSGHPIYVFGTDRLSDHPPGRAFDTWEIDGHPVVDARTPHSLVEEYMHAAAAAGSYNVGGPYLLGAAPQFFSDATHHDHVHAGFAT
jgi:hypothetical protein